MASIIVDVETTKINTLDINTNISLIDEADNVIDVTGATTTPKNCELKFEYLLNELEQEYYPTYQVFDGKNTITLIYTIEGLTSQSAYNWVVKLRPNGGIVRIKEWDAKIILFGQGLVKGDSAWDGRVRVEEQLDNINLSPNLMPTLFSTSVEGKAVTPDVDSIIERMHTVPFRKGIKIFNIESAIVDNLVYKHDTISTEFNVSAEAYDGYYVEDSVKFAQRTSYVFTGEDFAIDEGIATKAETNTTQFLRVDNVEVVK
jgi:hypothetical protein